MCGFLYNLKYLFCLCVVLKLKFCLNSEICFLFFMSDSYHCTKKMVLHSVSFFFPVVSHFKVSKMPYSRIENITLKIACFLLLAKVARYTETNARIYIYIRNVCMCTQLFSFNLLFFGQSMHHFFFFFKFIITIKISNSFILLAFSLIQIYFLYHFLGASKYLCVCFFFVFVFT